ncbi:Protein phosphatase 1L [Mortierella claussenii]|nr:Protein phosphatase 1L [Mortierella claussenii]
METQETDAGVAVDAKEIPTPEAHVQSNGNMVDHISSEAPLVTETPVTAPPLAHVASSEPASIREPSTSESVPPNGSSQPVTATGASTGLSASEQEPKSTPKKKKSKAAANPPIQLPGPLTALPASTPLPDLEDFNLRAEQTKNPLFVAICKVLLVYGNHWQSAMDLVDGVRHFGLASLGGQTPKGTIQGAISTGLAMASALKTFEPIEKQRMNSTTYYRMDVRVLEDPSPEARESFQADHAMTIVRRKPSSSLKRRKRKPAKFEGISSEDEEEDDDDEDDDDDDDETDGALSNGHSKSHSKRARTSSPGSSSSRSRTPAKTEVPNGLKKLPKGYVYDTEINQSSLMNLSINPSQTGEYMEHLKQVLLILNDTVDVHVGQQALLEIEYPDKRAEYGVDLTQEPSWFAVEQQTGYTYPRLRTSRRERLPKPECEDGYAVADLKHSGGYLGRLYCITDGHGGRACSSFVIATIPGAMQVILGKYKPEDISLPEVQEVVKTRITEAIRLIDKEYLDHKKQQYLLYKAKKIPHDPGSDGTTLIVNIFIDKWMICVNVGDSRSILSSRDPTGRWNVDFYSEDHTPSLERLAQTIYANGGEFVTHDDKVIKFDPTMKNDKKHRQSLKEARIRVKDGASNLYGIPYRTRNGQAASINLGACIGDVLYKLDPVNPVLSCKPDITFIDISTFQHGYLLMASDGLWDYVLRGGKVQDQNAAVCQFVGDKIDRGWNHQRIVSTLSDREGMTGLYSDSIQEYDDFTAILVTINRHRHLSEAPQQPEAQQQPNTNGQTDEKKHLQEMGTSLASQLNESAQVNPCGRADLSPSHPQIQQQQQQQTSNEHHPLESVILEAAEQEVAKTEEPQSRLLSQASEQIPRHPPGHPSGHPPEHLPTQVSGGVAEQEVNIIDMDMDNGADTGPESTLSEVDMDDSSSTDLDLSPLQDTEGDISDNASEDVDVDGDAMEDPLS